MSQKSEQPPAAEEVPAHAHKHIDYSVSFVFCFCPLSFSSSGLNFESRLNFESLVARLPRIFLLGENKARAIKVDTFFFFFARDDDKCVEKILKGHGPRVMNACS